MHYRERHGAYMKKIYLVTGSFPYGKGEKSFIEPELKYLVHHYDITIICHATDDELLDEQNISKLDERIKICRINNKVVWLNKIIYGLKFFCDLDGWREFFDILKSREKILSRLYQSIGFYVLAMIDHKEICRQKIIDNEDAIYYTYWYFFYCFSATKYKKKFPGLKFISRTHGFELYSDRYIGGRQPFKMIMDKRLDKLIFASDYAKEYYFKHYGIPFDEGKYNVCKLGVEKIFGNEKKSENRKHDFFVVSCSNLIDIKRIECIIEGLALIKAIEITWMHIGSGDKLEKLKSLAKKVLPNNITWEFVGYMSNENIHRIYAEEKVDCFITTSQTEGGCPVAIQEAMAYGIPVIGTSVGGITEMIHGNGILLSPNPDSEEVKNAIESIAYMSKEELNRMRERSRQIWMKEYNIEMNADKFIKVLEQL